MRCRRARIRAIAGFTLVEALLATALMAAILAAIGTVTAQWLPNWNRGFASVQRSEAFAARSPEQVAERAAVGMARGVNAFGVHTIILLKARQHRVEEFQVAVALIADRLLPAGFRAFRISEPPRRVETLHVNPHRLRPARVKTEAARDRVHRTAVSVKNKHDWREVCPRLRRCVHQRFARDALHGPLPARRWVIGAVRNQKRGKAKEESEQDTAAIRSRAECGGDFFGWAKPVHKRSDSPVRAELAAE